MSAADKRIVELLDRWMASVELHTSYLELDDAAYAKLQGWPRHQRPTRWILDLARSRLGELRQQVADHQAKSDTAFAESLELMSFLTTLLGSEHVERFIPRATAAPSRFGSGRCRPDRRGTPAGDRRNDRTTPPRQDAGFTLEGGSRKGERASRRTDSDACRSAQGRCRIGDKASCGQVACLAAHGAQGRRAAQTRQACDVGNCRRRTPNLLGTRVATTCQPDRPPGRPAARAGSLGHPAHASCGH